MTDDPDELLPIGKAAKLIHVDPATLRRWADAGRVAYTELAVSGYRRFRRRDLLALLREVPTTDQEPTPWTEQETTA
jgi:predicted site-specific integrase-resolvase